MTLAPPPLTRGARRRNVAAGLVVGALATAAWLALWAWHSSGYRRYLDHDGLAGAGLDGPVLAAVFVGGWLLMLTAMMLPTTWSLVSLFAGVVARRVDRHALVAWLIAGYLAVWTAAGAVAFAGDAVVHRLVDALPWIEAHPWALAAAAVGLAGAYQFGSLKERCLEKCRSPRLLIFAGWRGRQPAAEAFSIGVRHGRFCVGCCWALMLVMFGLGLGSLGWMLALGAVMAVEKNAPWGTRLTAPIGVALLVVAATLTVTGLAGAL